MKIGWLSFDNILNDLANNLIFANHEVFYLENKENDSFFKLNKKFQKVNSIKELVSQSDILFTYFKNVKDLYKFYTYPNGIFDTAKLVNKKLICIDLSLSSVNLVKKILSKNPMIHFLEAPIIFSETQNQKNTKIMPVSGRKYIYDKVDLILADLGIEHYYAGGFGSAQVIAGANNILKSAVALGFFEAVSYAKGNDLNLNLLLDSVKNGAGGSIFLQDFTKFFKKDNLESLNNNFIGAANQILITLNDNKKNKDEFLVAKIINGILRNEHNKSDNLDLNIFAKFYNLNLKEIFLNNVETDVNNSTNFEAEYKKNINSNFENEIANNKFEANFLTDDEKNFFDNNSYLNNSTNSERDFVVAEKVDETIILNNRDNLKEISDLNLNNVESFDDDLGANFYHEFSNNENQNNDKEKKSSLENQIPKNSYQSPASLKETKLSDDLKNHFIDKVDDEYGSLLPSDDNFVESAFTLKKENTKDVIEKFFLQQSQKSPNNNSLKEENTNFTNDEVKLNFDNLSESNEVEMKLNKSKILIFDLDGTLLNSNHKVNLENIKALKLASEKGNKIIIATGRCYDQIIETVNSLGNVVDYAIINNGALIYDNKKNFLIQNASPLSEDLRSFFIKTAFDNKISFLAYSELDLYAFFYSQDLDKFSIYINENTIDLSNLSKLDLEKYLNNSEINIYNFSAYQKDMSEKDWIEMFNSFKKENKCNITSALKGYIDIYSPTSKYFGYLKLKEIINSDDNDVYFFGDSNNDYDLLSYLKNSVAMGNANENVKSVASQVIGNNDSDAISEFLKKENLI